MHHHRPRRFVPAFLLTLLLLPAALAGGPALAAPAPTPHPADQFTVDSWLRLHPGGTPINAREIAYNHGQLIVTITRDPAAALATADCPSGWFCFYDGVNYTYPRGKLSSCGWQNLATWGWQNRIESVHYNMSAGTVAFLNEAGAIDTVLFTASTSRRTIADVGTSRNKADYVSRTSC